MPFYLIQLAGRIIKYILFQPLSKVPYIVVLHNSFIGAVEIAVALYIIGLVENTLF